MVCNQDDAVANVIPLLKSPDVIVYKAAARILTNVCKFRK
jgi:hypothetical protein